MSEQYDEIGRKYTERESVKRELQKADQQLSAMAEELRKAAQVIVDRNEPVSDDHTGPKPIRTSVKGIPQTF